MKISKKDQKTLLYILGVIMVIAVYFLYYSSKQKDLEALQSEVDSLYTEVVELEDYEVNNKLYKDNTKKYYNEIDAMVNEFPAGVKEESVIMYSKELENVIGVNTNNVTMTPATLISSFGVGERQKHLYATNVTMTIDGNYDQIKKVIDNIYSYPDKRTLTSVSLSYDSATGNLTGSMVMNLYALSGKDRMYQKPNTGITNHGTNNIFGQ